MEACRSAIDQPVRNATSPNRNIGWSRIAWLVVPATLSVMSGKANAQYTEKFNSWSATSTATWQTKSLSGAPFSVPANAVVEIAVRNANTTTARYGGVRAVGSSLERRLNMDPADGGGYDVFVMHVQADSSSQIQHYAQNTTDVTFVLVGYWACGTYVEKWDSFTGTSSWSDEDLDTYGVSAGNVAEIVMTNDHATGAYLAGVRTNGSSLSRRRTIQPADFGVDAMSMLVKADNSASATIETYAGSTTHIVFYLAGYWSAAPGNYVEKFSDIGGPGTDATWADIDLTTYGVTNSAVVQIMFANDDLDEENEVGVRANGSSLARLLDLRDDESDEGGDGDFASMHVLSDSSAVIEFRFEDVSDARHFHLIGYWDVGVLLSDHVAGQESDAFTGNGAETNAELFAFKLTPCAGTLNITQIVFRLTNITGLVNGDYAGLELLVDTNGNGSIGAGETTAVGGTGTVNTAAGTITFSTTFSVSSGTYYILRGDFASLSLLDRITIGLAAADVTASDTVTGSTTSVTHIEEIECYFEKFVSWSASSADTWQTHSLSGDGVPANAVVEIAVRNANATNERYGGVRAVGSSLDRRLLLNQATGGGVDILVMHVQTDSSSQIQHYSDVTADVDFVLLGYWTCGTYVETFDTFTVGSNTTWTDKNLCSYGVGPGQVAEIVMTNDDTGNEREAGVRSNGSSLARLLNIHQATGGGVDTATMFVKADNSTGATIEIYAQDNTDVDFYLVGYWSAAPLQYNELFTDIGGPSSSSTWEDVDLTSSGISDTAHAEFVLANKSTANERELGIRENGSSLSRYLNNQEADGGGSDLSRMHIASDVTATVERWHSNVGSSKSYYLIGEWDTCTTYSTYVVADLGAVSSANSSLGWNVSETGVVAGFEETSAGNPSAWYLSCGSFTSLGTLGGSYAEAHGINDSNRIVGWSHNASGKRRAFTYSGGTMTDLGVILSRTDSEAQAVNASAEVVGTVYNFGSPASNRIGFIYLPSGAHGLSSGMNSLGTLGGTQSEAFGINNSGQVVGGAQNASGNWRPFRWQNGTMTNLGTLGGETIVADHRAEAINTSGDVCGRSYTAAAAKRAFLWDGTMTNLGVLTGGTESWAFGLNESQVVVGTSNVTGGAYHAFVWDSTNLMRDLNNLIPAGSGWTLTRATDINDDGTIVGWGTNGSSQVRAFLLSPTCRIDGGAAAVDASILANGTGTTDITGVFDQVVTDTEGAPLAVIELVTPAEGAEIHFEVSEPVIESDNPATPGATTLDGFGDEKALGRRLRVITAAETEGSRLTVSLPFTPADIAKLDATPSELQIHMLDPRGGGGGTWVPAGLNIGESLPTNNVGESGRTTKSDGSVEYWCVRDSGGEFAVGRASVDGQPTRPTPRGCGTGMIPAFLFCAIVASLFRMHDPNDTRRSD